MHTQLTKRPQDQLQTATPQHAHAPVLARSRGYLSPQPLTGNHTVLRHLDSPRIQAKLNVSQPSDVYEQEADWIAEQVMNMGEFGVEPSASARNQGRPDALQRKCVC